MHCDLLEDTVEEPRRKGAQTSLILKEDQRTVGKHES